jgi:hypothetical protein
MKAIGRAQRLTCSVFMMMMMMMPNMFANFTLSAEIPPGPPNLQTFNLQPSTLISNCATTSHSKPSFCSKFQRLSQKWWITLAK